MPKPPPSLSVLPNPYAALDSDGEPAAAMPRVDLKNLYIGASIDRARTNEQKTKYLFDTKTEVRVPDLPTYRNALRSGDLLAADEATARAVGIAFVPPAKALENAAAQAAARWRAETGEDPPFASSPSTPTEGAAAPADR